MNREARGQHRLSPCYCGAEALAQGETLIRSGSRHTRARCWDKSGALLSPWTNDHGDDEQRHSRGT